MKIFFPDSLKEAVLNDKRYDSILGLIGHTPLVRIRKINPNKNVEILAKLEYFNPGGSIKDRPALYMIEQAEKNGTLTRDRIILEATSGNTGIGLCLVAAVKGYRIQIVMSEAASEERKKIMKAFGAELVFTPAHRGTDGAIEYVYDLVRKEPDKYWLSDQFNNEANWMAHYQGTAMEIWDQTDGDLDMIIATLGTTGTIMGLTRRFRELKPGVRVIGVEPYLGHGLQGLKNMKESYQPGIFDKKLIDRIVNIEDEIAFQTTRLMAQKEGLFCGMSSGAAMAAALQIAAGTDRGRIVVILPDGGERYLSTALFADKKRSGQVFYNTVSRRKEEFIPVRENKINLYSCGPTLNRLIHIGQGRRFVFSDLIRRYMEFKGYEVHHVMNLTDLDDRTIKGANEAGISLKDFTEDYFQEFITDIDHLRIKRAAAYPRAADHVEDMIELTQQLVEKGYAYEKFRSVYFDISRFKDYGRLSKIDLDKIRLGKTVDLEDYEKDNPRDFTLLKRSTLNELKRGIYFQTRWGNVRPSWHLECPAIALHHVQGPYDIFTGGIDLVFPHHENTIAISRVLTGRPLANYWLHNELVMYEGKKSSSYSDHSTITIREILDKGYSGRVVRYWLLSHHYRKSISFSWDKLDKSKNTVDNLDQFILKLRAAQPGPPHPETAQLVYDLKHGFMEAMDDDLNIAPALAVLFYFIREINRVIDRGGISAEDKETVLTSLKGINSVLEVMDLEPMKGDKEIEGLLTEREQARKDKDWPRADRIRRELRDRGVEVIDTRDGAIWRKKA